MAVLPGIKILSDLLLSPIQIKVIVVENYLVVGVYAFLILLALVNIWQILIKQKKYKTLPLLFFYIYSFVAITLRVICLIFTF